MLILTRRLAAVLASISESALEVRQLFVTMLHVNKCYFISKGKHGQKPRRRRGRCSQKLSGFPLRFSSVCGRRCRVDGRHRRFVFL